MARKAKTEETTNQTKKFSEPRLKSIHKETIAPKMMEKFGYSSIMQVPKIEKIVINMGVGPDKGDKALENSIRDLALITGQKPVATIARLSISNFKVREGMKIGCKVTLRGNNALHFFDKLTTVVLPRIRDFQGLSVKSFDGRGNYALGLKEQLVFTEISYDTFDRIRGMDIVICTSAKNDEESREYLKMAGLPLKEK
jgi:large subunit ribosomal protein L5